MSAADGARSDGAGSVADGARSDGAGSVADGARSDVAASDGAAVDGAAADGAASDGEAAAITVPYRVRFDECGPDGTARTSVLLRYAQDVAWIHSERLGFDRRWYADRGLAWVVRAAELAVLQPIPLGATLSVTTRVIGFRKVWARRRTEARFADGSEAAWGHTDWVMTDSRGLPTRVPPAFPGRFSVPPGSFEPGRVPLPDAPPDAHRLELLVRPQDLDPMAHVNNATYLDYLEASLLALGDRGRLAVAGTPRRLRIEYLVPAGPNEQLLATTWAGDGPSRYAWRLTGSAERELARARVAGGDAA